MLRRYTCHYCLERCSLTDLNAMNLYNWLCAKTYVKQPMIEGTEPLDISIYKHSWRLHPEKLNFSYWMDGASHFNMFTGQDPVHYKIRLFVFRMAEHCMFQVGDVQIMHITQCKHEV